MLKRAQRTLRRSVQYSGMGIHFGKAVTLTLNPAAENTGIVFTRPQGSIPALLHSVSDTGRSTTLSANGATVATVEHLLAALKAYDIDNVEIHSSQEEVPIGDGSSQVFVDLIEQAGVCEQHDDVIIKKLTSPVYYQKQDTLLIALPSDTFKISYTLHYPQSPTIGTQYYSCVLSKDIFQKEIAPCRTFALYSELCYLMNRGLIGGGCLENAVVFKDDGIISRDPLRFANEPVRHKVLDLIGDLSLIGQKFTAHIIAIGSGHTSNVALGRKILKALQQDDKDLSEAGQLMYVQET